MKIRIFLFGLLVTAGFGALAQNVGIGVSNPRTRLDIDGDIRIGRHNTDTMAGRIKYNPASKIFEGYDSTTWIPLQSRWSAGTGTNIYRPLGNVGIEWDNPTGKLGIIADATTDNIVLQKSAPGVFLRVYNTADISWPFQMSMGTNAFGDSYASLRISTGWPNQMTIHKSGRIGFGTDVPGTAQGMESCLVEFADDDPLHSDWGMRLATDNQYGYPAVIFAKSMGDINNPTITQINHLVGGFLFMGYDGTKFTRLAEIRGEVDGATGVNDMPGRILFTTKQDNDVTNPDGLERMRITNRGFVGIGTQAPAGILDVRGGTASSGSGTSINIYAQNGYAPPTPSPSINTSGGSIILMTGSSYGTGTIGNIGIGTSSPQGFLDIRPPNPVPRDGFGQSGKNILIYAQNAAITGSATGNFNGGNIILFPGSAMSNGTDGYVGISTTTPSEMLDVNGRIALQSTSAPSTTTNKLYNVGGTLYWNGSSLGGLPSLASGNIIVGDATGSPAAVAMSGDVNISNTGVTTIQDNSVDGTDIALGSDAQGDIMYYNGTDWVRLAAGTSGQVLQTQGAGANPVWATPSGGGGGATLVYKTADETRTSTTTLANDNTLYFATTAGTKYAFRFVVFYKDASTAGDFKYGLYHTTNVTYAISNQQTSVAGATATLTYNTQVATATQLIPARSMNTTTANVPGSVIIDGTVEVNTAGTLYFQFAQNSSSGSACTVMRGSMLSYWEIP